MRDRDRFSDAFDPCDDNIPDPGELDWIEQDHRAAVERNRAEAWARYEAERRGA